MSSSMPCADEYAPIAIHSIAIKEVIVWVLELVSIAFFEGAMHMGQLAKSSTPPACCFSDELGHCKVAEASLQTLHARCGP